MIPLRQTVKYLAASPTRLFWAFALAHLVLWTLIPSLTCPNLPLDVIEGLGWGKEWLLGTHKHPPMQAWVLEALAFLTGHASWSAYLASQICIVAAFWAVWQTGRRITGETEALIGVMLLDGIIYYNFTSPEFNPNVLQLPFWALTGYAFLKGVKDDKLTDWILCGVWAAAGMYSKYSTGLFLLMLGFVMLAHRDGRRCLRRPGPYVAVATLALLFIPHLSWLIDNHFLPLDYTAGRFSRVPNEHYSVAITTALMVAGQIIALLFALLLLIILYDRRRTETPKAKASFDRLFLCFAAFGPFIATFLMSSVLGYHIRDMWETPFWNFFGLWAIVYMRPILMPHDLRRFAFGWLFVFLMGLGVFTANEVLSPYVFPKPRRTIFPGRALAKSVNTAWHAKFNTPLNYVIGDVWLAGNVAWYAPDRPHVMMDADKTISPWITDADMKRKGGVIVWCIRCDAHGVPTYDDAMIKQAYPTAEIQPVLSLLRPTKARVPPAEIGWAIIPPQDMP